MANNKKKSSVGKLHNILGRGYNAQKGVTSQGGTGALKSLTVALGRAMSVAKQLQGAMEGQKPKKKKRPAGSLSTPQRGRFKRGGKVKRKAKY